MLLYVTYFIINCFIHSDICHHLTNINGHFVYFIKICHFLKIDFLRKKRLDQKFYKLKIAIKKKTSKVNLIDLFIIHST
jgi:hypothetical protein